MKVHRFAACLSILLTGVLCRAQGLVVTPANSSGVFGLNEKISWQVSYQPPDPPPMKHEVTYQLKKNGGNVVQEGPVELKDGKATIETSMNESGALLLDIRLRLVDAQQRKLEGVLVAPQNIQPASPVPDDFDAFWAAKVKQLHEIPPNPQLEPADGEKPGVDYYKIKLDNINNTHVYGQLAKPKGEGKYPALLILQWAGIYGLPKTNVTDRAAEGWLTLNIMPHDLPFDQPAAFYTDKTKTLGNYYTLGNEDRETSYFLRMYLSAYRAADYLASRPDWDGKTLVVMGTSMGGQQTLVMAGLHPKITAMMANVPSSCDVTGPKFGRAGAYPTWANQAQQKQNDKILETARYYDAANFATHIKCPALVALGLIDETCPPVTVYSAFNQIKGPKEVIVMVDSDHQGKPDRPGGPSRQKPFYDRSEEWLKKLAKGEPVIAP